MAAKKKTAKPRSKTKPEMDLENAEDTGGPSVNPSEMLPEPEAATFAEFVHHDSAIDMGASPKAPAMSNLDSETSAHEHEYTDDGEIYDGGGSPDLMPENFANIDTITDQPAAPAFEEYADGGHAAMGEMIELLIVEEA